MTGTTPTDAIASVLEEDVLGETQELLAEIHEEIFDWSDFGLHDMAFEKALKYACTWGFVTGYKIVFDARIGVWPVGSDSGLAIFLSFKVTNTTDTSGTDENDNSEGTARLVGNNVGRVQAEATETLQHDQDRGDKGVSQSTKLRVAQRILYLMLRYYGSITFPKSVCFVEDWVGNSPPCLLLPYVSDQLGRAEKVRECIIEQISIFTAPAANQSNEDEQQAMDMYSENPEVTEGHGE
ncbi:hypothetical protein F4782DRAFT_524743 [Xylaria castorea]|nr:hypothetical protein F4782DRAFT_524743 [Xylaria castorea]